MIVYEVAGKFDAGSITLTGNPQGEVSEGSIFGELTITGTLTPEGRIDGEWSTTIGTGGTFQLWPHNFQTRASSPGVLPEQLNIATRSLGAIRLYADDVRSLISQLTKDFSQKRAIITYHDRGSEKTIFSDDFGSILDDLPRLKYLKIFIGEPEVYGLQRNATVELAAWGDNIIRAQSGQEAWAIGKAESLAQHVRGFQRTLATQFRKFGMTVNVVITVTALAALLGLPTFWQRLAFLGSAFGIQSLITYFHRQHVPNFTLFSTKQKPSLIERLGPGVASWGSTVIGAVIAAIVYGLLKGELNCSPFIDGVQRWIS